MSAYHFARSRRADALSIRAADMRRGRPTRVLLASTPLHCFERAGPLRQTLLGKGKVFRTAGLRKLGQIPAASNRAPNHDQVHTFTGSEAQPVHRQEYAILVTGFHQSHGHNRTTPAHAGRTAKSGAGKAATAGIGGGGFAQPGGPVAARVRHHGSAGYSALERADFLLGRAVFLGKYRGFGAGLRARLAAVIGPLLSFRWGELRYTLAGQKIDGTQR